MRAGGQDARAPSRDLLQFAVRNHILIQIRDLEQAFPKILPSLDQAPHRAAFHSGARLFRARADGEFSARSS